MIVAGPGGVAKGLLVTDRAGPEGADDRARSQVPAFFEYVVARTCAPCGTGAGAYCHTT